MRMVTAAQMRDVEVAAVRAGVSLDTLMENAGKAVAEVVVRDHGPVAGKAIMVLVGPGNNGSDGLVAGRRLATAGANVTAYVTGHRPDPDPKMAAALEAGVRAFGAADDPSHHRSRRLAGEAAVIIDAILGTGQNRHIAPPLSGQMIHVAEGARTGDTPVVALDLPTGISSDTGKSDPNGLHPDQILMLGFPKLGPFLVPAVEPLHDIEVLDIGIPSGVRPATSIELITEEMASQLLPVRPAGANKGTFGRVLVIAGSRNYPGAARLACEAAARSGAGLVTLATPEPVYRLIASGFPDATYVPLPAGRSGALSRTADLDDLEEAMSTASALLIGPGLGQTGGARRLVMHVALNSDGRQPAVLDADCLNILAGIDGWAARNPRAAVLTPHPGEMARLTGSSVDEIQAGRLDAAVSAARKWNAVIVLKGACTVIASPDGEARIAPFANSGLATAGTGDVLAGLLAGLLAQGIAPFDAAAVAVFIHGSAGELARTWHGAAGMLASDLLSEIPAAMDAIQA